MNSLTFERQDGNVPASLAGEDHVSGIIFYIAAADIPTAFRTANIQAVSTIDKAEELGITADDSKWAVRMMHYHLSEAFRANNGISLYVGIFSKPETLTFAEIKTMQNFANGRIRQVGVWCGDTTLAAEQLTALQAIGELLRSQAAPLSILFAPKVANHAAMPQNLAVSYDRVSVVIAQAGIDPQSDAEPETGAALYAQTGADGNSGHASVSCLGLLLGQLSAASVQESVSWVKKFPSGISVPAFGDGVLVRSVDKAVLEQLDANRYLFLAPIVGIAGSYWNDNHNMTSAISDYNAIERVRTMDKAERGIRTYLTPELGGNVYIDATSGKLQPYTVEHLETTANKALEDMEKAGELSGYQVKIDPEQDVLSTSTVEVVIKNVPVGVIRRMRVKIGYVKKID